MRKTVWLLVLAMLACEAFAAERLVYETNSLYHHIVVSEKDNSRILRFYKGPAAEALGNSFAQSVISLEDPHALAMSYARYSVTGSSLVESPARVLFIGLGAGTMPRFYARKFPSCRVDVAELDEKVFDVARRFFFFPELDNLHVTVMDGRMFLRRTSNKYDIIFLDAYRDQMIPFHLMTLEFFKELKDKLAPGGILVSNIAVKDTAQLYPWMLRTYQKAFATVVEARVPGTINKVLICSVEKRNNLTEALVARARDFQAKVKPDFNAVACASGYKDVSSSAKTERVLTDDYAPVNLMWRRQADEKDWQY